MTWKSFLELDDRISHRLRLTPANQGWWQIVTVLAHSGDSWFLLAAAAVLWLVGNSVWRGRAVVFGVGIVVLACLVLAIKFTVRRQRPAGDWGAIYRNTDPHSFPSGHAARVLMLAVLGLVLGPVWFGLVLIVWAPLVSLARVMTGLHYLSDILAGMVLGLLAGFAMVAVQPILIAVVPFLF
ncbi:MAG: phosphatase PAP2 family protein [Anaerolineaceae bacterium]|nr:phosphatase PAP2 family protein [Anaerolineaceae bacterium]